MKTLNIRTHCNGSIYNVHDKNKQTIKQKQNKTKTVWAFFFSFWVVYSTTWKYFRVIHPTTSKQVTKQSYKSLPQFTL